MIGQGAGLGPCVVTIFVNPTQFNDPGDFETYPRHFEEDVALAGEAGAAVVFAPTVETVYPPGSSPRATPLPRVATEPGLEDAHRPGHFAGVCQVVLRLFELVRPDVAVFGEKDWQQLQVVRALVRRAGLRTRIASGATVRDSDGLALSSRNERLSAEERTRARALSQALCEASRFTDPAQAEEKMRRILDEASVQTEYAVIRHAETLSPLADAGERPARALVAGVVGSTRLIDNAPWPAAPV